MSTAEPPLDERALPAAPLELLEQWLVAATATGMQDANAMTLATAGADGRPSARTVLLRGLGADGLRFYTNRTSLKGRQLAENPRAQALFLWRELGRQVLVHGAVAQLPDADSDAYFASRARTSQLGAWASAQGTELDSREQLLERLRQAEQRFDGAEVERPAYWGGYLLRPEAVEYWQRAEYRLHDRFVYVSAGDVWKVSRLSP